MMNDENRWLIREMPKQERPGNRLKERGAAALSDTELLSLIIGSGPQGRSCLDVAHDLLVRYNGRLSDIATAPIPELCRVHGIGERTAQKLQAILAISERLTSELGGRNQQIQTPKDVYHILRTKSYLETETLFVLLLDTKHRLIETFEVTKGLVDRSQTHPREVFRAAIRHNCSAIILAHNHPSGDPTPSTADIKATRELTAAGRIIGITVLDHIVIGRPTTTHPGYMSLREENLIV